MQQQTFDFAREAYVASPVRLDPRVAQEVTKLMAAAIVAVSVKGEEPSDDESSEQQQGRQDHG